MTGAMGGEEAEEDGVFEGKFSVSTTLVRDGGAGVVAGTRGITCGVGGELGEPPPRLEPRLRRRRFLLLLEEAGGEEFVRA